MTTSRKTTTGWKIGKRALASVALMSAAACGGGAGSSDGAQETSALQTRGLDNSRTHFIIEGYESARTNAQVKVGVDPGDGSVLHSDGKTRYDFRLAADPREKDDLTVWLNGIPAGSGPAPLEITQDYQTPSVVVGVGLSVLKGYAKQQSGTVWVERMGPTATIRFEATVRSESITDRERQGKTVTVRGQIVDAVLPASD